MTVISTIISQCCAAVSSDSLITQIQADGTRKPIEWERSKIVRIPKFRASASYWGLATYGNWSTYDWLLSQSKSGERLDSFESFAKFIRNSLDAELSKLSLSNSLDRGIGIHLTGYEFVDGYWIPELFVCSNFADTSYSKLCCLHLTRETYHIVAGLTARESDPSVHSVPPLEEHREPQYRLAVKDYLRHGGMLVYNNGDPLMFNPAANSFFALVKTLSYRGILKDPNSIDMYRSIARRPIEIVSSAQHDFCREGTRVVGGRIHDLVITPSGDYSSSSGD